MTTAYFNNLPHILTEAIRSAKSEIHIAVCWFTLPEIFDALIARQQAGVKVQFIINFDQLNFSPSGYVKMKNIFTIHQIIIYLLNQSKNNY